MNHHLFPIRAAMFVVFCGAWFATASFAQNLPDTQTQYRQEMAACTSGQSHQDPATCSLEARNALAEAKRGGLSGAAGQSTTQRCEALQGDDRSDCLARMRGQGKVEGSVEGGGVLRETVTIVPAK